jgi:hypothetical protein
MEHVKTHTAGVCILLIIGLVNLADSANSFAQKRAVGSVCKQEALSALKDLPELKYQCREGVDETDEAILKWPERIEAMKTLTEELASLTDLAWWQAEVSDLNTCDLHRKPGVLSKEERETLSDGDYRHLLLGNHQVRLVIVPDPCYQTEFNGSSAFLVSRSGGKVSVTKVLDGYFSRVDNSVRIAFANLDGEQIVEISTGNNMPPWVRNYYYAINPRTGQAEPKRLFKDGKTFTNEVSSAMLLSVTSDLPKFAEELKVIRGNRLAAAFSVYNDDPDGKISADGRTFSQTVYRWNGRFYSFQRKH